MSSSVNGPPHEAELISIRTALPTDCGRVRAVIDEWWDRREAHRLLGSYFFVHFRETTLIMEHGDRLIGFLVGFFSQTLRDESYIHLVAIDPTRRRRGYGRELYERFFELSRGAGRRIVRAITAPNNTGSIAFHQSLGFELEPSDADFLGVPIHRDYGGPGRDRVLFVRELPPERGVLRRAARAQVK